MINSNILWGLSYTHKLKSILDVGIGHAQLAYTMRQTDVNRYDKTKWALKIDGVEINEFIISPMHRWLYNHIYIGDINEVIGNIPNYDFVVIDNVIEHLDKNKAIEVIAYFKEHCKILIIVVPHGFLPQGEKYGNKYEKHLSFWTPSDFTDLGNFEIVINSNMITAVYRSKEIVNGRMLE